MDNKSNENIEKEKLFKKFIESLSAIEKKALSIAQRNLESSFNLEKSIGYIEWYNKYNKDE